MRTLQVFTLIGFVLLFSASCGQDTSKQPGVFSISGNGVTIAVKMKPEKESLAKTYKAALKPVVK